MTVTVPRSTLPEPTTPVAVVAQETEGHVVWLHGEHDLSTVAELLAVLRHATGLDRESLVVDAGNVLFMDASTLGIIVAWSTALEALGRSLTIRSPSAPVLRLLEICRMESLLDSSHG